MSVASVVMICLLAFVLLAPTLMVAVLVSGLSRRTAPVSEEPGPDLGRLLVADGVAVPVEAHPY